MREENTNSHNIIITDSKLANGFTGMLIDLLDLMLNRTLPQKTLLSGDMGQTVLILLRVNNKLMRSLINMNIIRVDHDIGRVAKDLGHLLKWNSLGFRQKEEHDNGTETANNDEDTIII